MTPSRLLRLAAALCWLATVSAAQAGQAISVLKTSGCGCCLAWIKYLERSGFAVEARNIAMGDLMQAKLDAGLKPELAACHTAGIEGYVVEGHVPVREIRRLLAERPEAIGLGVPGMPLGSPGMEAGQGEPYQVLLVRKDGSAEIFAQYQ